ncbi:MAG: hypothetical protein QM666_03335 [Acinetobacter sp.]
MTEISMQAVVPHFFEFIRLGHYACELRTCEIPEKKTMLVDRMGDYSCFLYEGVTGFVRSIRAIDGHTYVVEVNWDDGSGKSNYETVQLKIIDKENFIFIDSRGRQNRMTFR